MFAVLHIANFKLEAVLRLSDRWSASSPLVPSAVEGCALASQADRVEAHGGHALHPLLAALIDPRDGRQSPLIVACTDAVREYGVEPGFTVPQALARCAGLRVFTPQPQAEAEAQAALLSAAFSLSPAVEATSPGVCTVHVAALDPARREPALEAALARLAAFGLPATGGLAPTPLLAFYAAQAAELNGGRLISRGAAHKGPLPVARQTGAPGTSSTAATRQPSTAPASEGPHRDAASFRSAAHPSDPRRELRWQGDYLVVTDGRAFLAPLPIAAAEPSAELAEILSAWGIRTLGELAALPKTDLTFRLGPEGLALWERCAGEATRPLNLTSPAQLYQAQFDCEEPLETLEPVLFLLRRLVDRLALDLENAALAARELHLSLTLEDETRHEHAIQLPQPTHRPDVLFRALHTHLENLRTSAAVLGVGLRVEPTRVPLRQEGLFDCALRDPYGLTETLARVAARVGPDRVGTPALLNSHRPDAIRLDAPLPVLTPPAAVFRLPLRGLSLRRFRPPLSATVELAGRVPAYLWAIADGPRGRVRELAGPWYSSGDWWQDGRTWEREEWDVEIEPAGIYRLFRSPDGWFVEGEYD